MHAVLPAGRACPANLGGSRRAGADALQDFRPSPFERMGYSADAEVHRPVSEDAQEQSFSQRQGLGAGQAGRPGGHRKTLSLPASNFDWQQPHHGRPPDLLSRGSHPIGRRSHSLQQMRERLSIAIHRGSVVRHSFA